MSPELPHLIDVTRSVTRHLLTRAAPRLTCAASLLVSSTAAAQSPPTAPEPDAAPAPAPARPHADPPMRATHGHHGLWLDSQYRSPGLAVALSLTPLPVDFGNLYAENLGWGIAYTAVELSLVAPMMWFVGGHMDHGRNDTRDWSDGERNGMIALISGYVVVKLAAGIHAGYAARDFNRAGADVARAAVLPRRGGALVQYDMTF
jgi:hypothetical protein